MKLDKKLMQGRNDGMSFALRIAEEQGIEGLKKEIANRKAFLTPLEFTKEQTKVFYQFMAARIFETYRTVAIWVMHEEFGFAKIRLQRFADRFDQVAEDLNDYDNFGERYVQFQDLAEELQDKYAVQINVDMLAKVDSANQAEQKKRQNGKSEPYPSTFRGEWAHRCSQIFRGLGNRVLCVTGGRNDGAYQ